MNGTWKTTGGGPDLPVMPVVAAVLAVALAVWLATILLIVAVVLTVLAGLIVAAAVMMRHRYPDYSASLAEQAAALRADMTAPKAAPVETHYHLHVERGADLSGLGFEAFRRDAVTEKEN